jgi:branched-chain amino acid transport system ATP-binding protein
MLRLTDVEVRYDGVILALQGLSLEVPEGHIVALLGANGAGKSTTLKAISGLLRAERGEVARGHVEYQGQLLNGRDPADVVRLGIFHVMEGRRVFEHLTVEENLLAGAHARGRRGVKDDLRQVYADFPRLEGRRHGLAGYLSGGEQQMLAIGRALMARPRLILLDEPSLGLAPLVVGEIFELIQRINRQSGTAILLVEQNARLAMRVAHYVYVMEGGRVVLAGTPAGLSENPAVQASYLGPSVRGGRRARREAAPADRRRGAA